MLKITYGGECRECDDEDRDEDSPSMVSIGGSFLNICHECALRNFNHGFCCLNDRHINPLPKFESSSDFVCPYCLEILTNKDKKPSCKLIMAKDSYCNWQYNNGTICVNRCWNTGNGFFAFCKAHCKKQNEKGLCCEKKNGHEHKNEKPKSDEGVTNYRCNECHKQKDKVQK